MTRVVVESPYAGSLKRNEAYAKAAVLDCLYRGEAPIASHLLYTQEGILRDAHPIERKLGIAAGHAWISVCNRVVVYIDYGWSTGMRAGVEVAKAANIPVEIRRLPVKVLTRIDGLG